VAAVETFSIGGDRGFADTECSPNGGQRGYVHEHSKNGASPLALTALHLNDERLCPPF
jgi:hypothetical protein